MRCQTNSLRLAAAQSIRRTPKLQIIQTHIFHEAESRQNFAKNLRANEFFALRPINFRENIQRVFNAQIRHVRNRQIVNGHRQNHRLQTRAVANIALALAHEPLNIFAHKIAVSFLPAALQIRDHTLICRGKFATIPQLNQIFFIARSIQNNVFCLF